MSGITAKSTRRAFFLRGSAAALGAGVAATAAMAAPDSPDVAEDREAIRRLHLTLTTLIQNQSYEAAVELFDEQAHLDLSGVSASGKPAILRLFADQYRLQKAAVIHSAYRQSPLQANDTLRLSDDRTHAASSFHVEVEVCTPLPEDCTAAQMARMQGQVAARRWESGRFEARYSKRGGQWRVASLRYLAT